MLRLAEEPSPGPGAYGAPAPPTARLFEKRRAATAAPPSSWALSSTARLPLNEQAARALRCEHAIEIVEGATHLFEEPGTLERAADLAGDWFIEHFVD